MFFRNTLETLDTLVECGFDLKESGITLDGNSSAGKGRCPPRSESAGSFGLHD